MNIKDPSITFDNPRKYYHSNQERYYVWYYDEKMERHCMAYARWLWITTYGDTPKTTFVHHIDGNQLNDSLDNLTLVDSREHGIYHNPQDISKFKMIDGVLHKHCAQCNEHKPFKDGFGVDRNRWTGKTSWCKWCGNKYSRKNTNRERKGKYQKKYREEHKEKIKKYNDEYYKKPDVKKRRNNYQNEYREKNRDEVNRKHREWRAKRKAEGKPRV